MPHEGPRDWMPKLDESARRGLQNRVKRILNEIIESQRRITGFTGPDEDFAKFVAEGDWDWQLLSTVFNSGYLKAILDLAQMLHLDLPQELIVRAQEHINEDAPQ